MKKRLLPFIVLPLLLLNSCLGLSMDIDMRANGSGRITLEYRVSNMAEAVGALDGNERWPTIPIGRADWERTAERSAGLSLASFSRREGRTDTVYNVRLDFENWEALAGFLDFSGRRAFLVNSIPYDGIHFNITDPFPPETDTALLELARQVSEGYRFSINFNISNMPRYSDYEMSIADSAGNFVQLPQSANTVLSGRRLSFSIDMADILSFTNGLNAEVRFFKRNP
jgi:hypothetical protein